MSFWTDRATLVLTLNHGFSRDAAEQAAALYHAPPVAMSLPRGVRSAVASLASVCKSSKRCRVPVQQLSVVPLELD